jgi:lipopolysaccharide transport system ATP-binding protein
MTKNHKPVMLDVKQVSLTFPYRTSIFSCDYHQVLDSVSFNVRETETLGIIGRNGVGKTTILRLMGGIIAPTSGEVSRRQGTSVALLSIGLGFKPQLSGRDNARLAAMLQGASHKEAGLYLEEIKAFSELGEYFERPVKTYSSGMAARLGFSTALLTNVDTMLIDEVLSVGDSEFSEKAEKAIRKRISGDQTVVFVSHSDSAIRSICDRVIWLNDGKIAAEGDPDIVLEKYHAHLHSSSQ